MRVQSVGGKIAEIVKNEIVSHFRRSARRTADLLARAG